MTRYPFPDFTSLTVGTAMPFTYTFPAASNNGKISQQSDVISGETVTYQYDSLNRLLSASSNKGWSETNGFDGFGNLLSKTPTGGAPTLSQAVNAATNQIVGQNYDLNGNQTSSSTGTLTYDAENRVLIAASGAIQYGYDSRNKRVWSATIAGGSMTQTVSFFGVDGQKLGGYLLQVVAVNNQVAAVADSGGISVYFAGKRVGVATDTGGIGAFTQDRLGSNGSYYPYGEARGTVPQDQVGFATYTNDSASGLQYADQRYYASNFGRFMSPTRTGRRWVGRIQGTFRVGIDIRMPSVTQSTDWILNGESVSAIHHELRIKRSVLYRWRDAYRKAGAAGLSRPPGRPAGVPKSPRPSADPLEAAARRGAELERKIGQQALDIDFFGKSLQASRGVAPEEHRRWRGSIYQEIRSMMPLESFRAEHACELARVSRAGFYRHYEEHEPCQADMELRNQIQRIVVENRFYGYRRVGASRGSGKPQTHVAPHAFG